MPTNGKNTRANKRHNKTPGGGAPQAERSLADWIRDAENAQPPVGPRTAEPAHILGKMGRIATLALGSPAPTQSNSQPSTSERIRNQLDLLWADIVFWKLIASSSHDEDGHRLRRYVIDEHGLSLPLYPPGLWKRWVPAKEERSKLFGIFSHQEWRWLRMKSTDYSERVECELWVKGLNHLFEEYLRNYASRLEMTRSMASREFSRDALEGIMFLGRCLSKDAKWCRDNKRKIPPDKVRRIRGKLPKVERARLIESLAALIQKSPSETDHKIAQLCLEKNPTEGKERDKETLRKLVGEAKRLVAFREGLAVVHHVDPERKCGQRPSRKLGSVRPETPVF